jgi:hypothetical protein
MPAGLVLDADLRVQVTTAAGESASAHVQGNGRRINVTSDRPDVLFAAVDRADVGRMADLLAAAGVTVDVVGPVGGVATLGADVTSRVGRLVTGSTRVAVAPRAARHLVPARAVGWTVAAVGAVATAIALGVWGSRRA